MRIIIKEFTELTAEELYQILQLRAQAFVVEQECVYNDCDDRDRKAYHLYVEQNGNIAGYLRIVKKGEAFPETAIGRLVVREDYRGIGLARHMMNKALLYIQEYLHEDKVDLAAQKPLVEFYRSLGFYTTSDKYLEDGIPHINMECRIG